jgi:hypothetical protein
MTFKHPLTIEHSEIVMNLIFRYSMGKKKPLRCFRDELIESISNYYLVREGIESWIPALDPAHPRYEDFDLEIVRIYNSYVID